MSSVGAAVGVVAATLAFLGAASRLPPAPDPPARVGIAALHVDIDFATGAWSLNGIPFRVDPGGSGHFDGDPTLHLPHDAQCTPADPSAPVDKGGAISWNGATYFLALWFGGPAGTGCDSLSRRITHLLASPRPDNSRTSIVVTSD